MHTKEKLDRTALQRFENMGLGNSCPNCEVPDFTCPS